MTPIVCRCFHIFASDRTGAKWERFSIPVKSSTRSQDRRKQVVEPSVVSKRGATFMCFEARLSSPWLRPVPEDKDTVLCTETHPACHRRRRTPSTSVRPKHPDDKPWQDER